MDINITLLGEMLTFAVLVWVMMRYIWPPLMKAIEERQQKIADGLEKAEQGKRELELAKTNSTEQLHRAKIKADMILDLANKQANDFIAEGKINAQKERTKILAQTKLELEQATNEAKHELQQQSVDLIITAAEKILQQKIDVATQKQLIAKLIASI